MNLLDAIEVGVAVVKGAIDAVDRANKQRSLEHAPGGDLPLLLLGAQLSRLAYQESQEEVITGLLSVRELSRPTLLHWQRQTCGKPQWYMLRGAALGRESLFLVFRGTHELADIVRDLFFLPIKYGGDGLKFHAGFLNGIKDNHDLKRALCKHAIGKMPLYVFGHSLGGALAHVLVYAGLLPRKQTGQVTACGFGAPCVLHGARARLAVGKNGARVMHVVNDSDLVPRLLGSEMKLTRAFLKTQDKTLLNALERYRHADAADMYYIDRERKAVFNLPLGEARDSILHLHAAAHPEALGNHSIDEYERLLGAYSGGSSRSKRRRTR